jgi:hypothetical protein
MTQQTGSRPGEAQGVAANVKDRLGEMADTATDKVKDVAEKQRLSTRVWGAVRASKGRDAARGKVASRCSCA